MTAILHCSQARHSNLLQHQLVKVGTGTNKQPLQSITWRVDAIACLGGHQHNVHCNSCTTVHCGTCQGAKAKWLLYGANMYLSKHCALPPAGGGGLEDSMSYEVVSEKSSRAG